MDRIALAVDTDEKLADFFSIWEVLIYEKQREWKIVERIQAVFESSKLSTESVRQKADMIARKILSLDCKYLVGKELVGIPYHTLCRAGIEVFEAEEASEELFDAIYEDFLTDKQVLKDEIEVVPPRPIAIDDESNYYFDFTKAIKCHPQLSSKKMLIPFLTNDLFYSLQIVCEHVMPWMEVFVSDNGLSMEVNRENGIYHVLITHKSCND